MPVVRAVLYAFGNLPLVLVLSFLTVILHHHGLLDVTDSFFMRWAVQDYLTEPDPDDKGLPLSRPRSPQSDRIQVLEASAAMRVRELEPQRPDSSDIERVGGVRPIDRAKLANVLTQLAELLDQRVHPRSGSNSGLPKLIAIDVDVTPLGEKDDGRLMIQALHRLRKHASVVTLAMERPTAAQRLARNRFMLKAACTQKGTETTKALYFASPGIFPARFRNYQTFPVTFPFLAETASSFQPAGTHFPSLSNLLHLSQDEGAKGDGRRALTLLCDQAAHPPAGEGLILQDIVAQGSHGFDDRLYGALATNWTLQKTDLIGWATLESRAHLKLKPASADWKRADALLDAGVLLISVDGGDGHDKFSIPSLSHEPVSGAMVHALQALSVKDGRQLHNHSGRAFLVDVAIGFVFLLAWYPVRWLVHALPKVLVPIFHAAAPLALALAGGWLYAKFGAPWLLGQGYWATPAYVLAGLVLHAYVEAAHHA